MSTMLMAWDGARVDGLGGTGRRFLQCDSFPHPQFRASAGWDEDEDAYDDEEEDDDDDDEYFPDDEDEEDDFEEDDDEEDDEEDE